MLEAAFNMMANYIPSVTTLGRTIPRLGRGHAQIVPYQAFMCSDGKYVMVGAFTRVFWHNLCRAMGHEEWITDPRFRSNPARLENRDTLVPLLEALFQGKPSTQWAEILTTADVPNSAVMELHEAVTSEQVQFRQSIQTVGGGGQSIGVARNPIRAEQWGPVGEARPAPEMGRDTRQVLRSVLGLDEAAIRNLADRQIVQLHSPSTPELDTSE